jgi:hypothetical protein
MNADKCLHGNTECMSCEFPKGDEFLRGQRHAEKAIAAWLHEVAKIMSHNGIRSAAALECFAEAIERGEWKI